MDSSHRTFKSKNPKIFYRLFSPILFFILITCIFFYPVMKGYVPFPGDLLVGEYTPYNTYEFMGYAPGGFPNKAQGFDIIRFIYPAKEFSIESLKNAVVPLWNPYMLSGNPHIGSLQSGTFYPLNGLFFFMNHINAWSIYIMLQTFLAGIFTYLLLSEFGLRQIASFFGSIAFAFSSYMVVWLEYGNLGHTYIWLPFSLWLICRITRKVTLLHSILLTVVLSSSILAGYIQTSFYLFVFLWFFIGYFIVIEKENKRKLIVVFVCIFMFSIALTAFQLFPTIELILNSARPNYPPAELMKLLIPQIHLITLLVPDFFGNPATRNYWLTGTYIERVSYIGVIPLFFAIYGIGRKLKKMHAFFLISTLCIYLLAFNTFLSRSIYALQLPFISTAVPSRIMFLFCFSASIVAAYGFEKFLEEKGRRFLSKSMILFLSFYTVMWMVILLAPRIFPDVVWTQSLNISLRNSVLPTVTFIIAILLLFVSSKFPKVKKYTLLLFVIMMLLELFYFFHKITPFSPRQAVYPQTDVVAFLKKNQEIYRTWGYGKARIDTNLQLHEKIYSTDGYEPLHNKRYGELLSSSNNGYIEKKLKGSIAEIVTAGSDQTLRDNPYRQALLNLLGVKYVLNINNSLKDRYRADTRIFPEDVYKLKWQEGVWQIYENKLVWPRYFLSGDYTVETDANKIIGLLVNSYAVERKKIILEENIPNEYQITSSPDSMVKLKLYLPNKSIFETSSSSDTIFFLSDNYFPGWRVSIDEESAKIYRANYSFRAVVIPKGKHIVTFSYEPVSFFSGLLVSVTSLTTGLVIIIICHKKRYVS